MCNADTRAIVVVSLLIVVLFASGVGLLIAQQTPSTAQTSVTINITRPLAANVTIPVVVGLGSAFTLTLPSNQSTGYAWRIENKPAQHVLTIGSSVYNAPESTVPGQGGTETWSFQAVGKGKTTVMME